MSCNAAVFSFSKSSIFRRKFVAVFAVSLSTFSLPALRHHVLSVVVCGAKEQMLWINTITNITSMTYKHALWNDTFKQPVGSSVSAISKLSACRKLAVAFIIDTAYPQPAGFSFMNLFPESIGYGPMFAHT
jgi:hypothetical protein